MKQNLLGLEDLSADQIKNILSHAAEMKKIVLSDCKKIPNLQGKTVVNLFYENSTRTRTSFELAQPLKLYLQSSTPAVNSVAVDIRFRVVFTALVHRL